MDTEIVVETEYSFRRDGYDVRMTDTDNGVRLTWFLSEDEISDYRKGDSAEIREEIVLKKYEYWKKYNK